MKLTKKQAREFILSHQKLIQPRSLSGRDAVYDFIKHVGCIQFDPLNMVGYNPFLVLQSRIKDFKGDDLYHLIYDDRKLLDGWDKCMSIYPVEDWPYFERYRKEAYDRYANNSEAIKELLPQIREDIHQHGPLSSKDIKIDYKIDWAWAPTRAPRAVLESMFYWGEILVHHKVGTRRFYDYVEKHIPQEILGKSDPNQTLEDYLEWHVKRRIGAIGLLWDRASDAWIGIHWMKTKERRAAIERLINKKEIIPVSIEGIKYPCYIRQEEKDLLEKVMNGLTYESKVSFIAPLDNMLWDRNLIEELFNFEYRWEVYTPAAKRKYGYYVLPVLYGDRLIGRFEPRYYKEKGLLEIKNWWWESVIALDEALIVEIAASLECLMAYLGVEEVKFIGKDKEFKKVIKKIK
ncbi:winged helix-turn-helix domain-containing protein [Vallitalea okinawensis]|uniref:winged helix-turn-helix domain-containing protein n=1 Tax=Vallitalea okinawensis TaxID=2078660 RepID=UPI000CFCFE6F|nr:crosslink repair DNA glycosylase YcaQ family protein [Vallitalea okinawensis]